MKSKKATVVLAALLLVMSLTVTALASPSLRRTLRRVLFNSSKVAAVEEVKADLEPWHQDQDDENTRVALDTDTEAVEDDVEEVELEAFEEEVEEAPAVAEPELLSEPPVTNQKRARRRPTRRSRTPKQVVREAPAPEPKVVEAAPKPAPAPQPAPQKILPPPPPPPAVTPPPKATPEPKKEAVAKDATKARKKDKNAGAKNGSKDERPDEIPLGF